MKNIVIICPTQRDRRELQHIGRENKYSHNYIFYGINPRENLADFDPLRFLEGFEKDFRKMKVDGIIGTHDYPGSLLASILCEKYGLSSIGTLANILCQNKYHSRIIQKKAVPRAVPDFKLIDPEAPEPVSIPALPVFIKPVKSFFSIFARRIDSQEQYKKYIASFRKSGKGLSLPLNRLMKEYSSLEPLDGCLLAEEPLEGKQVTLEGYVYDRKVFFLGITDSVMYPGTISFKRFDYPSRVPQTIAGNMIKTARKVMEATGLDNGMFNIEFFYDEASGDIKIIEINPRMASQFADLVEKVDGTNSYKIQIDLALGRKHGHKNGKGRYKFASSFVLRSFEDKIIKKLPGGKEIDKVFQLFPDARIELYGNKGSLLSSELQDMQSYRYGIINLGGGSLEDLKEKYKKCRKALTFEFKKP